jgi:cholesterol oxidase
MGRDMYRGKLELVPGHGRRPSTLRATLPADLERPGAALQERVLRTIARAGWNGELRTNPAWAPLEKHVTVHSQGGCPMGTDPEHSVTDPWGEVHHCPGLYVMDAAAFPTSVGVNPSATIAAVAELKIERFIRCRRDKEWETPDKEQAISWVTRQGRDDLDPLRRGTPPSTGELAGVLGLEFAEKMEGFASPLGGGESPTNWEDVAAVLRTLEGFAVAEDEGMRQLLTISAELKASVADLAELIAPARINDPVKIAVTGTVRLRAWPNETSTTLTAHPGRGSFLQLFVPPPPDAEEALSAGGEPRVRFFRYELHLADGADEYTLEGLKVLRDERGHDVWSDTATLFFEMKGGGLVRRGILRLSLAEFARGQLPSMEITGTTDAARKSWALAAFAKYFARGLADLYMTRADQLVGLLGKAVTAIHV